MPASGSPKPTALNSAAEQLREPDARRRGRAASAITPTTSASPRTVRSTCRRIAPIVRSMANSRMRWATVIEKVLKMTNAPTSTAAPANASSGGREERVDRVRDLVGLLLGRLGAGLHLHEVRQRGGDPLLAAPPARCPGSPSTEIVDVLPTRSYQCWASAKVVATTVAPPMRRHVAEVEDADDRHRLLAHAASSAATCWPTCRWWSSASCWISGHLAVRPRGSGRRRACSG